MPSSPSVSAELSWLLNLLVRDAPYVAPALAELDRSLLPGVHALRPPIRERFIELWDDGLAGCPELMVSAGSGGCLENGDVRRLLAWFSTRPKTMERHRALLTEAAADRRLVRRRLERLDADIVMRRRYRDILAEIWRLAGPQWERRGRAVATRAAAEWRRRLANVRSVSDLVRVMPPRHPLARGERSSLVRRRRFLLVPIYFCMSGGAVVDLDDSLLVGVPASSREPVRRIRDAAYVADRTRILAEPTRVHILIHLMSAPSGVMEITRALAMSQPTVSEHVRVLSAAGLIRRERRGPRTVYVAAPRRVDRILEDARATLARWGSP